MAGCPSSHQPTKIREEMLESGGPLQRKLNFRLRTHECEINKLLILNACCNDDVIKRSAFSRL